MSAKSEWTVQELQQHLERKAPLYMLDVRNQDEFDNWKIEGRTEVPTINVPYFDILEEGGQDDMVDSVVVYAEQNLLEWLPSDQPILVVCAKGGTSDYVAQGLRRLGYDAINLAEGMEAWGDFYWPKAVVESPELSVYQVGRPARGCLSYIIASNGEAVIIDPLRHVDQYLDLVKDKGWKIKRVFDTHAHADHISGAPKLAEEAGVDYHLHPYDAIHPIDVLPAKVPYAYLSDGQVFTFGAATLEAIHIPGHTLGNTAYLLNGEYLFAGDSIFIQSIARPDLGGRGDTWAPLHYHSLNRLMGLPESTTVLPGHFSHPQESNDHGLYSSSLGELKRENEGLQVAQQDTMEFTEYILESLPKFPEQYVDIKRVNAGLLEPDEDLAAELELGKNICALSQAYQS